MNNNNIELKYCQTSEMIAKNVNERIQKDQVWEVKWEGWDSAPEELNSLQVKRSIEVRHFCLFT